MDFFTSFFKREKYIVYELTRKQVKTQYRDSSLGFIWTILNPFLNSLVMWFIFSQFFAKNDPYYPLYLLTGNILFAALRSSTSQSLGSIVGNRGLILKTKIELYVFPMGNVCSSVVNFIFSLIALIPFMIWLSIDRSVNLFSYQLLFIFLMLPAFWLFEFGISLFLAALFVFFRDIKHIYSVFLTLWNYMTPIFYKVDMFEDGSAVKTAINFNPMYHFVNYFRESVYSGAAGVDFQGKTIGTFLPTFSTLGYLYIFGVVSIVIGFIFFKLTQKTIITKI